MKLSVVIPVYNELRTISETIRQVENASLPNGIEKELIIIDDFSTDGTRDLLKKIEGGNRKVYYHDINQGKGAALRTGYSKCTGDIIIVQDADLEYDPNEYSKLITPIVEGEADIVYGSRFLGGDKHRVLYFWHSIGNKLLTLLSNMFADLNLTDMETCYKAFRKDIIDKITIEENRFGIEPEITAKIAELARAEKFKIYEVGISYKGRTYEEGKKIKMKDAFRAAWCIWKYNTTTSAKVIKYLCNGILVALFQLFLLKLLVDNINIYDVLHLNLANLISIEAALIFAFFLHSQITWRIKFKSLGDFICRLIGFHVITFGTTFIRILIFYFLSLLNVYYLLSAFIGIVVSLIANYQGYDKLVFDEPILEPMLRKLRLRKILSEITKIENCCLLDIGCGHNYELLRTVEPHIFKGVGIDFKVPEISKGKITTKKMILDKRIQFDDFQFNIITMLAVLEHLSNPQEIVCEIERMLKPNGKLIITVPSRYSKGILEFLAFKLGWISKTEIADHKKYYSKRDIQELILNTKSLKIIKHKYFQFGLNNFCIIEKV